MLTPCTILVVEDEPSVLNLVRRLLHREGYHVLAAGSPAAALALAAGHEGALGLVLTDVVMPEMDGHELFDAIARDRPNTQVMYMTGYDRSAVTGTVAAPAHVLCKPFSANGLLAAVRDALAREPERAHESSRVPVGVPPAARRKIS